MVFSIGLASTLVAIGLLLISARGTLRQRWNGDSRWLTYLPFVPPVVITSLGIVLVGKAIHGTGLFAGVWFQ